MIDELNIIKSLPYIQYFYGIGLTDEQVNNRIAYANKMEEIMLWLFAIVLSTYDTVDFDVDFIKEEFRSKIEVLLEEYFVVDDYLEIYLTTIPNEIVETTVNHIGDTNYWFSNGRAVANAENESETVWNYSDYIKAISEGKTMKKWVDVRDSHERVSHLNVGGTQIGIFEYFHVGDCLMRFPKDMQNGTAEEICNCRCQVQYL